MQTVIEFTDKIDALPYVDPHDDHSQRQVEAEINKEMRRFAPPDYLAQLPAIPNPKYMQESAFLVGEMERLSKNENMARLDIARYKVEAPSQIKKADPEAWEASVKNAEAQLEHQYLRLVNLELLNNFGSNAWKMHNSNLEVIQKSVAQTLEKTKKEVEDVNRSRKMEQDNASQSLRALETRYYDLVRKNYDIESACLVLEQDVQELRNKLASKLPADSTNDTTETTEPMSE